MKKIASSKAKEKAESIMLFMLYPFVLLFGFLKKSFQMPATKRRKIGAGVMAIVMILTILPISAMTALANEISTSGDAIIGEGYRYDPDTKTLTVSTDKATTAWRGDSNYITIRSNVTTVVIESGVTTIGMSAFEGCTRLDNISIPSGVTSISDYAFAGCISLASVSIPNGVTSIGNYAFHNCGILASVTIPSNVNKIGEWAFSECTTLTSVIFEGTTPPSLFGSLVFKSTHNDLKIYVPADSAETYKTKMPDYTGKIYAKAQPIIGEGYSYDPDTKTLNVSTDEATTEWRNNTNITKADITTVVMETGVTRIRNESFSKCTSLESVTIPSSVTSIGAYAFGGCASLESVTIPENVTYIDVSAFEGCTRLASVIIPEGVTKINNETFSGCTSLVSVTIPEGVTLIGNGAFRGCTSLGSVSIPSSVTTIDNDAFTNCSNLVSVIIPSNVTSIGRMSFYSCKNLASVTFEGTTPPTTFGTNVFTGTASTFKIYVPADSVETYKTKMPDYAGKIQAKVELVIGEGYSYDPSTKTLTVSTDEATTEWRNNTNITKEDVTTVVIESGVTSIEGNAFYGCTSLESVTISEGVTTIGDSVFYGCTSLVSVTIPSSVTTIGNSVFYGCTSLASVTIPEGVTSIMGAAFAFCTELSSVTIPKGVTSIEENAFFGCTSLESVTIPEGVVTIGGYAFNGCTKLASVTIQEGVTSIGMSVFFGCTSLESVTIPSSVTSIGLKAFCGCTSLESVTIPEGVTSIGYSAFENCTSIESITIPKGVTTIERNTFKGCTSLVSVTIPEGVTSIGNTAFDSCTDLKSVTFEGTTPPAAFGSNVFDNAHNDLKIHVPKGTGRAYKAKMPTYSSKIVAPLTPETTPSGTFTATGADSGTLSGLTAGASYQYSLDGGTNWADFTGATANISGGINKTNGVQVVKKGDNLDTSDSEAQKIALTQPNAPTGVGKTDETWALNNGTITNVTNAMEYKLSTDTTWKAISGTSVTGLSAGTYNVRVKANGTALASADTSVTIAQFVKATPAVSDLTFDLTSVDYNGSAKAVSVTPKSGKNLGAITVKYAGSATAPTNAGTYPITVDIAGSAEYKSATGIGLGTFTINKVSYTGTTALSASVFVSGQKGAKLALPTLPAGASYGTAQAGGKVAMTNMSVEGTTLTYTAPVATAGQTGTITIPVAGSTNYKDFNIVVTLTYTEKTPQVISYANTNVIKTYGDGKFINILTLTTVKGDVKFTSSDTSVATVNPITGEVTIVGYGKDGTATITVTVAETDTHAKATASYTINVAKKDLVLKADNMSMTKGGTLPTFAYTATGLVNGDTVTTAPTMATTANGKTVGTFDITIAGGVVTNSENYNITYTKGTLTVSETTDVEDTTVVKDTTTPPTTAGGNATTSTSKEEPKTGSTVKNSSSPKTGDNSNLAICVFLLLISGCVVGTVKHKRKKTTAK